MRHLGAMCAVAIAALAPGSLPARAQAWSPEPASFGMGKHTNLAITAADGTVLRADVYYPTDRSTGAPAPGPFPVLLTQDPYGKENAAFNGSPAYFVDRGYIFVHTDVRGTGASEGEFGLFDPAQARDGADWVNYAARLPHADGKVGLIGGSYLGIDQFATAAAAGPAHVKAMFPEIAANDIYRDTAFAGGLMDLEFDSFYLGLTSGLNLLLPATQYSNNTAIALDDHVHDLASFDASLLGGMETGGDDAYDQSYWETRDPNQFIPQIVKDRIPAFLVGGWYDIFLRGELLNYSYFQNAYDHRPVGAPMSPTQPVTPRYQLLMGPWYHTTAGDGLDYHGLDLNGLQLAWFDHWLKGTDTAITDTTTPLHLEDLATGRYQEAARYPLNQTADTTYYLQPGGSLSPTRPTSAAGADELAFTGSQVPCTSSTEQWIAGFGAEALAVFGLKDPCTQSAGLSQLGPGTQSYTTAPFGTATTLAGPIAATIYATTTTHDAEWVVQLSDVAPNGSATALTSGLLEGNQRALDAAESWNAPDGNPILPDHPYTKAAQTPITPGKVTRFDIEIFPTFDTLEPGHRLRVTIATSDFPHALATANQLPGLLGGIYEIERNATAASSVELPLAPAGAFDAGAESALGCPTATGRLNGSRLGPVRLGLTRAQTRRAFAAISTTSMRGRVTTVFYCLRHGGIRVGYPSIKLLRSLPRRLRGQVSGRAVLILTANAHYSLSGIGPGVRMARAAAQLKAGRGLVVGRNTWYVVGSGRARGVLKVQHGTIEEIGIANQQLVSDRAAARRFFTSFG